MKQYIVDAFTDKPFHGNPAAVMVLDEWLSDELMLNIARENNLSETAYTVSEGDGYRLRWFTPGGEVDFCGHATLGTAFVIMNFYDPTRKKLSFYTQSGEFIINRDGERYSMDLPAYKLRQVPVTDAMEAAIGVRPMEAYMGRDLLCVLDDEEKIRSLHPNLDKVEELDGLLLQVTAKGRDFDCVSRTFAPKLEIPEDPVCGSGHCHIIPYWADKLGKTEIKAYQASPRGGTLHGKLMGDRVILSGNAVLFSVAEVMIKTE